MKRIVAAFLILSCFFRPCAHSAEVIPASASLVSSNAAESSSEWQNWVFAGAAVAIGIVCAIVVSLDSGKTQ